MSEKGQVETRWGPVVSVQRAAEMLDVHPKTIRNWIHEKRIHALRINHMYRVQIAEIEQALVME